MVKTMEKSKQRLRFWYNVLHFPGNKQKVEVGKGIPWKDRLLGSSWQQRGLSRWPRIWWDDRRAMTSTGEKVGPIFLRLGLGLGLGFVPEFARAAVGLLSAPSLSASLVVSPPLSLSLYLVAVWENGVVNKQLSSHVLGAWFWTFFCCKNSLLVHMVYDFYH